MKMKLNKTVTIGETSARNGWQIFVVVVFIVDFQFNYGKILLL
jgi:hypothetical protein